MASRKRQKLEQCTSCTPPLVLLPTEVQFIYLSYCEFRSLVNLRATNVSLKSAVGNELRRREQYILTRLPLECNTKDDGDDDEREKHVKAILRLDWSQTYSSKRKLIREALTHANPPGILSQNTTYDDHKARRLFRSRWRCGQKCVGWIDNTDFLNDTPGSEEQEGGSGESEYQPTEPGWGVLIKQGSFVGQLAWSILSDMLSNFDNYQNHEAITYLVREYMSALLMKSKPLSVLCGYRSYDYLDADNPSGGKEGSLMIYTSNNTKVELFVSSTV